MQVLTDRKTAIIHVNIDWGLNHHVEAWDDTVGQDTGIKDKNGWKRKNESKRKNKNE